MPGEQSKAGRTALFSCHVPDYLRRYDLRRLEFGAFPYRANEQLTFLPGRHCNPCVISRKPKAFQPCYGLSVVIPFLGLVSFAALHAQVTSGSIVGVVYDQSGAAIPNSTVTATDVATGAVREVETNSSGYYTILSLPPDPYKVTASATGFAVTNAQIVVGPGAGGEF